ncbi:MAG: YIP1 family protein [bacterium]|nr:YIP1 family protein [bacterium]
MPETNLDMSATALPENKGLALRGLWEVFTAPTSFFQKLAESPKILLPWILIGIIAAISFILMADVIFETQWQNPEFQEQMQNSPGMTKERMQSIMAVTTPIFGTLALLLAPLLIAALASFWGNFVFGGQATFRQLLSVSLYGELLYFLAPWYCCCRWC